VGEGHPEGAEHSRLTVREGDQGSNTAWTLRPLCAKKGVCEEDPGWTIRWEKSEKSKRDGYLKMVKRKSRDGKTLRICETVMGKLEGKRF